VQRRDFDLILLTQKLGKEYFIKAERLGNIPKRCINTARDKRVPGVPQTMGKA
jgi:hypothetical protein